MYKFSRYMYLSHIQLVWLLDNLSLRSTTVQLQYIIQRTMKYHTAWGNVCYSYNQLQTSLYIHVFITKRKRVQSYNRREILLRMVNGL